MAGREAEEEFPCSACSELLPEEVKKKTKKLVWVYVEVLNPADLFWFS